MNIFLVSAGCILIVVGLIHSILGERLIFKSLREEGFVATIPAPPLLERHIRILWATWHIASILSWGIGALLIRLSVEESAAIYISFIAYTLFLSGLLVFYATNARHPGWVGLCLVGILCWLA